MRRERGQTFSNRILTFEIHLRKDQIERANEIFDRSSHIWNVYAGLAKKYTSLYKEVPTPNEFDTDYYQKVLKPANPEYWDKLPSKCRQDTLRRCYSSMVIMDHPMDCRFSFKSKDRMVSNSFFFIKNGIRLTDPKHIWIPILHSIKLKERWKDLLPLERITSGRIIHDIRLDKWYVSFVFEVAWDYGRKPCREKHIYTRIPMGLTFGFNRYFTVYSDEVTDNRFTFNALPMQDPNIDKIDKKIYRLNQYIDHKIQVNKLLHGYRRHEPRANIPVELHNEIYNTSRIRKLRRKIARLYERARNYRAHVRKNLCNLLVRFQPRCICIDDEDSVALVERQWEAKYPALTARPCRSFSYYNFIRELGWQCLKYNIPLFRVNAFASWNARKELMQIPQLYGKDIDMIIAKHLVELYKDGPGKHIAPEVFATLVRPNWGSNYPNSQACPYEDI